MTEISKIIEIIIVIKFKTNKNLE